MRGGGAFDRDFELFGEEFCNKRELSVSFSGKVCRYEAQANNSPQMDHEEMLLT